jgi:hypothetical protein
MMIPKWVRDVCGSKKAEEMWEMFLEERVDDKRRPDVDIALDVVDEFGFEGDDREDLVDWLLAKLDELIHAEPDYDVINDRRVIDGC